MGCGNSSEGNGEDNDKGFFHRRPKVSIRVHGSDVESLKSNNKHLPVVFVFGGPGSRKGRIVDDLIHMYGFQPHIVEDMIMRELPKKVQNVMAVQNTKALAQMLMDNPNVLDLEWVIDMLIAELEQEPKKMHLIDLVPNLKFLLRCENFLQEPDYHLKRFCEKYPDCFALNLSIPEQKVVKEVMAHGAKHPDKMKEGGQSDEADSTRTQRRHAIYAQSVKGSLNFFKERNRLVIVDVSCGVADVIWNRVSDFFGHELEVTPRKTVNTVIVFSFDEKSFEDLDMKRYHMEKIHLSKLVDNPNAPLEKLIGALCHKIDNAAPLAESFIVDCSGTTLSKCPEIQAKRQIKFYESENTYLDKFIFISNEKKDRTRKNSLYPQMFNAVATTENEVCLFAPDTSSDLCHKVADLMGKERDATRSPVES
ncbi:putative UMP-CMP kinase 2 [Holothuria leucospilota]|uniref:UMP-CMP kinase 2 n=1 Tax=Holothuria leucospilota TaxID=206669 RepID=A0A9Q1HMF1_HOLLE|nr:putative UMP-CMP kinase 2 [Holothuria leucospilota]